MHYFKCPLQSYSVPPGVPVPLVGKHCSKVLYMYVFDRQEILAFTPIKNQLNEVKLRSMIKSSAVFHVFEWTVTRWPPDSAVRANCMS